MRIRLLKLMAFVVMMVTVGAAFHTAAQESRIPPLTSYELENGLQVVLAPDSKVPKVTLTLRYKVGSLNEPAGRSGFAHLFEHLTLFAGTKTYPKIDAAFTALGITYNGYTQEDGTTYYATGMASTLPVMLSVHADQMANVGFEIDQADLDLQRSVVLNEMRQNVLDTPAGAALTTLQSAMFPKGHPYSRAVIGSIADLQAATLEDTRLFFATYYAPSNAVLVIVGDFDVEATRAMIEDTFGRIVRGPEVVQPAVTTFEPTRARFQMEDAIATPLVYLAFTGPDLMSSDSTVLYFVSDLMSNESGLLRKRLINTGIATYAGGTWSPGKLGGRFIIYAGAGPGVTAEQLEAALKETVAEFVATPVDKADLERARDAFLLGDRTALEAFETRSAYIARTLALKGDITHAMEDDADVVAATAADVEAAIRKVIVLDDATIATVLPGPRGDYPPVLSDGSGEAAPLVAAARLPVEIPVLTAGQPEAATLPTRETATLSNGIKVIHYQMVGAPLFYMSTTVTGGYNNDPRGKEGLYDAALSMGWRGAGDRDLETLSRVAKDVGATVGTWAGSTSSGATLSVPADHLADGVELLADVVQKPRFAADEWQIVRTSTLNYLVQRDQDLLSVAQRGLNRVVFFPGADDSEMNMSAESVTALTLEEAKAAYDELFVPATMVIYSVGDLPLEAVTEALEARFGTWDNPGAGVVAKPSLQAVFPKEQQVYLMPMPGASQATIHVARPAPGYEQAGFDDATAVTNLLGSDFSGRLNSVIREQKGYSYGVSASLWNWYREDGAMTVTIPVQIDATGAALQEVFKGFDSLVAQPVTTDEVNRTITAYYTSLATLPETAGGFFGALVGWEQQGVPLDEAIADLERMTKLDLEAVRAEAVRLASLEQAVVIIAGDPKLILPQLEAIGISDVLTVPEIKHAN